MSTSNLREKINTLTQLQLQADIEAFQLQLAVTVAEQTSGDAQIDDQIKKVAQNAASQLLAVKRRLVVYRDAMTALQAELDGSAS